MLSRLALILALPFLTTFAAPAAAQRLATVAPPSEWVIGPIIRGRNYSKGMPLHPTPRRDGGFEFDLPQAPGSAHYVTFRHGSLEGKRLIRIRYRIEAERGARVVATSIPKFPGLITPFFQRSGDNWGGKGRFETYRWFGTFATREIQPGTFELVAPLAAKWTAIEGTSAHVAPAAFRDAIAEADQVGFVLGGGDGYSHGVHVVGGRARLIVTQFRID